MSDARKLGTHTVQSQSIWLNNSYITVVILEADMVPAESKTPEKDI